jgi:hypothetical protein
MGVLLLEVGKDGGGVTLDERFLWRASLVWLVDVDLPNLSHTAGCEPASK